jgi:hypothetical protein
MVTNRARRGPLHRAFKHGGSSVLAATHALCASNEPRLDRLFAEPIVQQLMHRDRIDEAATRRLLQKAAAVRAAPKLDFVQSARWPRWTLGFAVGLLLLTGIIRQARNVRIRS